MPTHTFLSFQRKMEVTFCWFGRKWERREEGK